MKFGLTFPFNEAHLVAQLSQLAEQAGWDGIFLGDAIWCQDPMIALAAAAMTTRRIRLGTMVIPVPLRRPWKIASESVALDRLSDGRLILGMGTGAVWMGWQSFPNEVTDTKARAEMLNETIDILTLLYQRNQFDYSGKYYHLKLTLMDEMHYPPKPVQQPRIPLWVPAIWPRQKSMERALKCDGLLPEKRGPDGNFENITPKDVSEIKEFVTANRKLASPLDIVVSGKSNGLDRSRQKDEILPWLESGATWWIEGIWGEPEEAVTERVRQGPPLLD
jgi:hypothetical protein